jgi:hypothetical protein
MIKKEKFYGQDRFFKLFRQFIREISSGRRLRKDGKKIRYGSLRNYIELKKCLVRFTCETGFEIRLFLIHRLSKSEKEKVRKYWKKFYNDFTDYLYFKLDYYDNTVGGNIKLLRSFFNYLNNECNILRWPGLLGQLFLDS